MDQPLHSVLSPMIFTSSDTQAFACKIYPLIARFIGAITSETNNFRDKCLWSVTPHVGKGQMKIKKMKKVCKF